MRLHSPTPEATAEIARELAASLDQTGLVLLLSGPLGAGKTHFVKGLAAGLGVPAERVASPTFVLAQELPLSGGRRLVHVDCYRVGSEVELEAAGLLDWLAPGALLVAEWAERLPSAWPSDRLALQLERSERGDNARELSAQGQGRASAALLERWTQGLAAAGFKPQ